MPPALPDDDRSSDPGSDPGLPIRKPPTGAKAALIAAAAAAATPKGRGRPKRANAKANHISDEDEDSDEDDEDESDIQLGEGEFIVETILDHVFQDGELIFRVKWEGYNEETDLTWEPESNLKDTCHTLLRDYLNSHGGRTEVIKSLTQGINSKKRGRASAGAKNSTGSATKRAKKDSSSSEPQTQDSPTPAALKLWVPPAGSWEDLIDTLDACQDENTGEMIVYATWKNGHKTRHERTVVYKRAPQKMLEFYERHVKIVRAKPDVEEQE